MAAEWKNLSTKQKKLLGPICAECCFFTLCTKEEAIHILTSEAKIDQHWAEAAWELVESQYPDFSQNREQARKETPYGYQPRTLMCRLNELNTWMSYVPYIMRKAVKMFGNEAEILGKRDELMRMIQDHRKNGDIWIATKISPRTIRLQRFGNEREETDFDDLAAASKIMSPNITVPGLLRDQVKFLDKVGRLISVEKAHYEGLLTLATPGVDSPGSSLKKKSKSKATSGEDAPTPSRGKKVGSLISVEKAHYEGLLTLATPGVDSPGSSLKKKSRSEATSGEDAPAPSHGKKIRKYLACDSEEDV